MLTKLKKKVQSLLSAEAKFAHTIGLTPNMVSITGLILALCSSFVYAISKEQPLFLFLATLLFLFSGFCDALDGILARNYMQESEFGGFFDSILDRYADAAVYTGIIIGGLCDPLWGLIALMGSLLVSYSRARAEAAGIKMESVGIAERAERMIILAIATIATIFWSPAINIGIIVLGMLSHLTVFQRIMHVFNNLNKKGKSPEN